MSATQHAPVQRSAESARAWPGAALLSRGFRPFFLGAGVWALVGMAIWPAVFSGAITIPTAFSAVDWHAHEMIFGYGGAVVAGFLLTAIPNWTGRLPVAGVPARRFGRPVGGGPDRRVRFGADRTEPPPRSWTSDSSSSLPRWWRARSSPARTGGT